MKKVLDKLCEKIEHRYLQLKDSHVEDLQKEYMKDLFGVEEDHLYRAQGKKFSAKIVGLTAEGKLVLMTSGSHEVYGFKEVELVG